MSDQTVFEGRVAIVTGGGSGIGLAAAHALATAGATTVLFGSDREMGARAARELQSNGLHAEAIAGDVAQSESVAGLVAEVRSRFGRIDILVNSAAIQPYGTVVTTRETDWDRVMSVNLKGIYLLAHHAIPVMKATGGGAIVNVASVQGIACQTNVAAYVASKGAVLALTRAMALDHAKDGIRVNAVCPGSIDTPMLRFAASKNKGNATEDEIIARWGQAHPIGRVGTSAEVGAMIAFLCGPTAGFCTGGEYKVDGGLLAKIGVVLPD
jgi:NAD(P)-dependent dehydrogenase (short-subunit alcohol dehydrogenase family)